jgi:transcriptional regulatory protein GAL4
MTSTVPSAVDYPTPYSAIIAQSQLAIIANRIHTISMSAQASGGDLDSSLASTEESIDEWKKSLPFYFRSGSIPSWFRAPRATLFWKEQNLRILLWQALERRPTLWPGKTESRLKCCTASLQAVFSISSFCSENTDLVHRGLSWYATYFLFQATLVLLLFELQTAQTAGQGAEHYTGSWTQGIAQARDCLTLLGKDSNAAKRCLAVLHRIQSGVLFPSPKSNNTANAELNGTIDPAFHFENGESGASVDLSHMLLQDEASPETAALFGSDWSTAADPSLSTFLGDNSMQGFFQDFNGFPGTVEHNHFDYINYNMYNTGYQS